MRMKALAPCLLLIGLVLLSGCARSVSDSTPPPVDSPAQGSPETKADPPPAVGTPYAIDKEKSTTSYKVGEKFVDIALPVTAVGTTSDIEGDLMLSDDGALLPAVIKVDMRTLKSDEDRRDGQVYRALKVSKYPYAEFAIATQSQPVVIPADGQEVVFKLSGTMTLAGKKNSAEWDAKARREGDTLFLTATIRVTMRHYNVEPPSLLGFVTVNDEADLEVKLIARKR